MVQPLVEVSYGQSLPQASPRVDPIDESIGLIGTATALANAAVLPVNTPTLFRRASVGAAPADLAAAQALVAAEDWRGVYDTAQTKGISETLDFYIRQIFAHIDDEVIVVRVAQTAGAPPTEAEMNAAIAAMQAAQNAVGRKPGAICIPEFGYARETSGDFDAVTPPTAIPYLSEANALAVDLDATLCLGGSPEFTRAEAVAWANANRGSEVVAVFPAGRGADGSVGAAIDGGVLYAISMLSREQGGAGRGTSLQLMPALGYEGITPVVSQGFTTNNDDVTLLNAAGVTSVINIDGGWRFRGVNLNTGDDTDIVSIERLKQELEEALILTAVEASSRNISEGFFEFVINGVGAIISNMVAGGRVQDGTIAQHPTNPVVNNTTAQFVFTIAPYSPASAFTFTGRVDAPTF